MANLLNKRGSELKVCESIEDWEETKKRRIEDSVNKKRYIFIEDVIQLAKEKKTFPLSTVEEVQKAYVFAQEILIHLETFTPEERAQILFRGHTKNRKFQIDDDYPITF